MTDTNENIGAEGAPETDADGLEQTCEDAEQAPEPADVTISHAEHAELRSLAQERDDFLQRLQRAVADYQNLQKRSEKFRQAARIEAVQAATEKILPMADHLLRAREAAAAIEGGSNILAGLDLIEDDYYAALAALGVRPIDALGQKFDPHFHEAIMQQPTADVEPLTVITEIKRGFMLGDTVIRPSQVVVAAPPLDA
jgi:molecular chaperone GrpE